MRDDDPFRKILSPLSEKERNLFVTTLVDIVGNAAEFQINEIDPLLRVADRIKDGLLILYHLNPDEFNNMIDDFGKFKERIVKNYLSRIDDISDEQSNLFD